MSEEKKVKGQKPRSEAELRAAFTDMKRVLNAEGLSLQVDSKGRCTVVHATGDSAEIVLGPKAGNTFITACEGAKALARFVRVS